MRCTVPSPKLQIEPWNTVVMSGIGCSSRLPGYVNTYGFNSVHGRALTLATGVKAARPELTVIAVGGDGDGMAIGGNHFIHSCRRNLDVTYILMDNEIYGLTKGQVAPTTPTGDKTKSTFWGNPEPAVDPCELAISTGATWVGRGFSGDMKTLVGLMTEAITHHGFSFLNVMSPVRDLPWRRPVQGHEGQAAEPARGSRSGHASRRRFPTPGRRTSSRRACSTRSSSRHCMDRIEDIRERAMDGKKAPSTRAIFETFYPPF